MYHHCANQSKSHTAFMIESNSKKQYLKYNANSPSAIEFEKRLMLAPFVFAMLR